IALGICNVLTQTFTSLLFFLRVTAVWHKNRYVFSFFTVLWLGVIAGAITVPVGIRGAHIGTTQQCINIRVPKYDQLSVIMPLIFDSCTFVAITCHILLYSCVEETIRGRLRAFFGRGVPVISRNLLLGGQQYYLYALDFFVVLRPSHLRYMYSVAVCGNIVCLIFIVVPGLPPAYRGMLTIPILAINNAVACIVFRRIKFGLMTPDGTVMAQLSTFHATSGPDGPTLGAEYQEAKSMGIGLPPLEVRMMEETARYNDDFPLKSSPL
ncbi:hypothetical protein EDD18DRAFT_1125299, partial [Armillaria luteobubalina]